MKVRLTNGVTNLLTTDVLREVSAAVDDANAAGQGLLLCGGKKFFSNGVDIDWGLDQSPESMRTMFLELGGLMLRLLESPRPAVGAIMGHAIGGAKSLYLACDYRYAATGRVLLGAPEILLGVPNPYFADRLLRFVAGDFVASDLIYTGEIVSAEQAVSLGLVHEVGPADTIEDQAMKKLKFLCDLAPEAFAESKRMRTGGFCADVRNEMSVRVSRQADEKASPVTG